jgi:hypothetical protein
MQNKKSARNPAWRDGEAGGNIQKAPWWQPSLVFFARLSGWIGGPIIIAALIGKWLDHKYQTEPWLFLGSVGVAFFISTFAIVKEAMKEMKRIEDEAQKSKIKNQNSKSKIKKSIPPDRQKNIK